MSARDLRVLVGGAADVEGKLPPHDLAAEAALIGANLVVGGDRLAGCEDALAMLCPEDFFSGAHRYVFEAIADLSARGEPSDAVTVATWLTGHGRLAQVGGMAKLAELLNVPSAVTDATLRAHARTVRDCARLRAVLDLVSRVRVQLYAGAIENASAFVERFEQDVFELARPEGAGAGAEHVREALRRNAAAMTANVSRWAVPTGYERLDALLGGGLRPKALSILGGLTSAGKSALAMNIAVHAARSTGVLACSLEMTHDELAERISCAASGVPLDHVRERRMSPFEWSRYIDANVELGRLPLVVADEPGQSIATIRSKARRVAAEMRREGGRLGLVVVDYLQLVKPLPGPKNETREQQVAALSRNLKGLAKDLDVHVLALAQLNAGHETRKGDDKRPRLGDLRESKAIANDADVVAFVHREDYQAERDDRDGRAPARGFAEVIVAKQRGGRTGVVPLIFDRARCRFEAAPDDPGPRGAA